MSNLPTLAERFFQESMRFAGTSDGLVLVSLAVIVVLLTLVLAK